MKDRYYFELTTAQDGKRYIHFFGNFYKGTEGAYVEEYTGAVFELEKFNFTNATQEEISDFFYEYIYNTYKTIENQNYFNGTEILISDIPAAPDGEYFIEAYNL